MTPLITIEQSKRLYSILDRIQGYIPAKHYWYDCYPIPLPKSDYLPKGEYRIYKGKNQKNTKTIEKILMIYPAWTLEEINTKIQKRFKTIEEAINYIKQLIIK